MDQLWLSAPALALRVWSEEASAAENASVCRVNAAAVAWAERQGVAPDCWQAVALKLRAELTARADVLAGLVAIGTPAVDIPWTAVALPDGWLVWLDAAAAEVTRLTNQLDIVQKLGRIGAWERDMTTGEGRWDRHMFELTGFEPQQGTPHYDEALQRVHPDDVDRLRAGVARYAQTPGLHEVRYRISMPDGQTRHLCSLVEIVKGVNGQSDRMVGVLIDETQTAQRLHATEASAEKWVRAIDLAAVSVWRLDLATGRAEFNDWGYRMLGMPPDPRGLTVDTVRDMIHPDDREAVLRAADEAIALDRAVDVEARYRRSDGQYRHLLTRRVAIRDEQGHVVGLSGVSLDVTDRVLERERAQAFMSRIDRVTNAAGVGIWSVDVGSREIEWNDQMFRLYGLPRDQAPPEQDRWLNELVHAEDRQIAREHRPVVGTGPQGRHAEFRIVRPDGEVRWVASWSRRETLGGSDMAFGVNLDITDLQRAQTDLRQVQERARLAAESAGIGTWERNLRTGASKWDAQMYRLRGLPVGPEAPSDESRHAHYLPEEADAIKRHKARAGIGSDHYENEYRVMLPDGSIRWLAARGLVKRDATGEAERMLGVTWDITERRDAEQALRDKTAAEQASLAKSQFLARMSHELRTPLNAVLGFAQLLRNDTQHLLGVQQRERVDRIHSAGLHLLALIDDVLDLATIESDSVQMADEPVSLQDALDDVSRWTQLQAAQSGVIVQSQAMAGWVRGDPRRVRQILSNLISNAIKYNRPGGKVWVSAQACVHRGAPGWSVAVRDTGRGFTAEQRVQMFQPFNRLGAERGSIQGTGIGLAIVHHLMRQMGGEVAVTSEPGQGSEFRVILPAEEAQDPSDHMPLSGYHGDIDDGPPSDRLKVLYIEDNPVNALLVQELVSVRADVVLTVAEDGLTGVAQALAGQPHVVLVDMQLPDIDGFEVLRRLIDQRSLSHTSFVALSANAMTEDVNRALQAGFDDYWTKPIDFHTFLRALTLLAREHLPE